MPRIKTLDVGVLSMPRRKASSVSQTSQPLEVQTGERWVYTGYHTPWRDRAGKIGRLENPFEGTREGYLIARLYWDDPPDRKLPFAYITPYNRKEWTREDRTV
jgi:hypothetical protein